MMLPDYFLADVPGGPVLTPQLVTDACITLKQNRTRHLVDRTTAELIELLARVAGDWLEPDNPFRRRALEEGPGVMGFSRETLNAGLDDFFGSVTEESLRALVTQDVGHPHRLERPLATEQDTHEGRRALAVGPELLVHVTGGVLPNPPMTSLMLGLLARSAQFMKCARGTSLVPRLFAHSLREVAPKLAATIEIAEWRGGDEPLEAALLAQANCVTATGRDTTLASLRQRLPVPARWVSYGHRVSVGYVTHEMLSSRMLPEIVQAAARDVAAWDQLGCLSPQAFYVESGGRFPPEHFAEALAGAMEKTERVQPAGPPAPETAAAIAARRRIYELRAANLSHTRLWQSPGSTAWTVVHEEDPDFKPSCGHRFVPVKPVANLTEALKGLDPVRGQVSTVGLGAPGPRETELVTGFARWGVTRICPLGRMQIPPLSWRHDGRPSLGDLLLWCDWESSARW
ncbi:MAG: hypothetical protein H7A46_10200 [Verrucomicrobiales bacterium]|nr:hypothetical protein [Verrucomicrobiales bacterium]